MFGGSTPLCIILEPRRILDRRNRFENGLHLCSESSILLRFRFIARVAKLANAGVLRTPSHFGIAGSTPVASSYETSSRIPTF